MPAVAKTLKPCPEPKPTISGRKLINGNMHPHRILAELPCMPKKIKLVKQPGV
jgi:hypothetical protein